MRPAADRIQRVRLVAWGVLLLVGAIQGWAFRHSISPDGVAYLDLSDAVVQGRFGELVNGYWSPAYPVAIGVVRFLASATPLGDPYWEFTLLHVVNFLAFVLSLAGFEWFLRTLDDAGTEWGQQPFATPLGRGVAYLLFGIVVLSMISVQATTPDLLVSATAFAAFACLLRLRDHPTDRSAAIRLGLVLAVGALTKAFFVPLGAVMLVTLAIATWRRGGRVIVLTSAFVFALATLPWFVALSVSLGRPSTGESGSLNFAWYVNGQQPPNTGVMPALAAPVESLPLTGLAVMPRARGTNPLWYDPARWHRDIRPRLSAAQQWSRLSWSIRYYVFMTAPLLFAMLAIGAAADWRDVRETIGRSYVVLLPSVAALGAYAMVYTTSRLIAPFLIPPCLALAAAFPTDARMHASRFGIAAGVALYAIEALAPTLSMVLITSGLALFLVGWLASASLRPAMRWAVSLLAVFLLWVWALLPPFLDRMMPLALGLILWYLLSRPGNASTGAGSAIAVRRMLATSAVVAFAVLAVAFGVNAVARIAAPQSDAHPEWSTAQRMIRDGTPAGSRIAVVGNPDNAAWARLARYQIVGVVPEGKADAFWKLSDADRARIMRVFANAGASRLITLAALRQR